MRVFVGDRRYAFTSEAVMLQRGARRAGWKRRRGRTVTRRTRKSEADEAGRAKKIGRISVDFVSTLFEIDSI